MGSTSDLMIEMAEQQYEDKRAEWIRRELNDDDADEFTDGWYELAQEYDARYEGYEDYIEEEYRWLHEQEYSFPYAAFCATIKEIEIILSSHINPTVTDTMYKMAHVHAVIALETYLGDTLNRLVMGKEQYFLNAAKNIKDIKKKKLEPHEILGNKNIVEQMILEKLSNLSYQRAKKAMETYKNCLGFSCTHDLAHLEDIADTRNDIVHRNGKDKSGTHITPNLMQLKSTISEIESFVHYLDKALITYR